MNTTETRNKIELNKWKNEAGPRQTKDVQKALNKVLRAGGETLYKRTSPTDGKSYESIETLMFGEGSPAEQDQKARRTVLANQIHGKHSGTITRANCRDIIADCQKAFVLLEAMRPVVDERKTPEQVGRERIERKAAQVLREAEQAEKAQVKAEQAEDCKQAFPYLERQADSEKTGWALGAANLRRELKRAFPTIKFTVKSESYSMGCSIRAGWTDGPTGKAVEAITDKYQYGNYDYYTDCAGIKDNTVHSDTFGGAKHVFAERTVSEDLREAVRVAVEANTGGNPEDWETGEAIRRETNRALSATDLTGKGEFKGVEFNDGTGPTYTLIFETVPTPEKPKKPENVRSAGGNTSSEGHTIEEHTHTRRGFQMFIVVLSGRADSDTFNALREQAKEAGGWYSRAWQDTPAGFAFKEQAKAEAFAAGLGGSEPEPAGGASAPRESGLKGNGNASGYYPALIAKAERLRATAERLAGQIETKRAPMTQNPTPKRTLQHRHNLIDADHLERVQRALLTIADQVEGGTFSGKVPTKGDLMRYLGHRVDCSGGYYSATDTGEYSNTTPEAVEIQTLLETVETPEQEAEEAKRKRASLIVDKQMSLVGCKIPGFFVTPPAVVERIMFEAEISEGETVLEPSAGTGNLADAAREAGGVVTCVEIRPALVEILKLKDYPTANADFLEWCKCCQYDDSGKVENDKEGFPVLLPLYDKIVMNPPFEKGQDINHIMTAFDFNLRAGGRLVAIMGEGAFFRLDSQAVGFRDWLESVGGRSQKLPEGSFKAGGEITQTGTATRIVVINK